MNRFKVLLLWVASLLILMFLVRAISPYDVGSRIRAVDGFWLVWAAVFACAATLLGAINSYLLVTISHRINFSAYVGFFWVAWACGLVLPGQVGDMGVLSWLMKRNGMRWTHSLGRLFLDKLVSLFIIATVAACGLLSVLDRLELTYHKLWWGLGGVLVVALSLALAWRVPAAQRWLQHALNVLGESAGIARRHPLRMFCNIILTTVKVVVLSLSFWFVFKSVGLLELPFLLLFQLMAVSSIVAYLPLSMNGVGTVEVAGVTLFSIFGVDAAAVLSGYLVSRMMTLVLAWLPSLLGLAWLYLGRKK